MDELGIILRPFDKEKDEAFIYSSWCNQSYYSAVTKPHGSPQAFFNKQTEKIKSILDIPQTKVMIACLQDSPDIIAGYSVSIHNHLYWIYVKEAFRKAGIGKLLTPKNIETFTNQLTKIGKVIAEKKHLILEGE